ncbi:ferrochelatase [bacterium]|nr:MAG: ferrochelatase [bacterium]RKZ17329.1 MAG: ferrochelatase [bacterium]
MMRVPPLTGVLLSNLGTPQAPTAAALRPWLREFLSDRRVVDLPRPLWWLILNLFILPTRPARVARAYRLIWTDEGSPLMVAATQQRDGLEQRLQSTFGGQVRVALGMRYGEPSIASALESLVAAGCTRILHLPLYPQYSGATVATNHDALFAAAARGRRMPTLRTVNSYAAEPAYITALANSVRELWQRDGAADRLMISFHGLPQRHADEGDPYPQECSETATLLARELGLTDERWELCFQSRFGREPWLQPYTDHRLKEWGREGVSSVDVICPGFSADCLETLEEIDVQNREFFQAAGGGRFRYIPALNARPDHLEALMAVLQRELGGWSAGT